MTEPQAEEIIHDTGYWSVSTHRFVFETAPALSRAQQETVAISDIASFRIEGQNVLRYLSGFLISFKRPDPVRRFVLRLKSGTSVKTPWHSYYPQHQKEKFDALEKALGEALGKRDR